MKKLIVLIALVFTTLGYSQAEYEKIAITANGVSSSTNKINTQEANGEINHINATSLPVSTATTNALELETDVSAGAVSGFALTNNGNGTVNIGSGIAYLRATNDPYSAIIKYPISAVTNLALTDNANNFVLVDYNSGSPTLTVTTNSATINIQTNSLAYVIARVGTTLNYLSLVGQNVDPNAKLRDRFLNQEGIRRLNGAVLGFSNRNITLTAGVLASGLIKINTLAFNTASPDTFTLAYNNGATWTRTTGQTQINNSQYNVSGTLTTLGNGDYRTDYVYLLPNNPSKLYVIMGTTSYSNLTQAKTAPRPSALPVELQVLGLEVGRLFIQKNNAAIAEVQSSFANDFVGAGVPEHNALSGIQGGTAGEYNHLTNAQVTLVNGSEQTTNKATSFTTINNTLYPTVQAVSNKFNLSNSISPSTTDYVGFGDSITYGVGSTTGTTSYTDILNTRFGFRTYTKLGVSAATVKPTVSRTPLSTIIASSPATATLVTLMIGVNDWDVDNTIGDVTSVLKKSFASLDETQSFAEAFRFNLETIKNKYPTAKIIVLTPLKTSSAWTGALDLRHYVDVEIAIANFLSIPVIDLNTNSGIYGSSSYLTDGLHPNDSGYQLVANAVADGFISNKQAKFSDNFNNLYVDDNLKIGASATNEGYASFNGFKGISHGKLDLYPYGSGAAITVSIKANGTGTGGGFSFFNASGGRYGFGTSTDNGTDKVQVNGTISASAATLSNQVVIRSQLDAKPSATTSGGYIPVMGSSNVFGDSYLSQNNGTINYISTLPLFSFTRGSTDIGFVGDARIFGGTDNDFMVRANNNLRFYSSGTERARFVSGGNFLIGTTTDNGVDLVQANGNISAISYTGGATLTGTPTAPTATAGTNTTQIATTAFVQSTTNSNALLLTGNQTFTGVKSSTIAGSDSTAINLANQSTATGSATLYIDVTSTGSGNGQRGITIINNNAGAAAAGSQAIYIDNNNTGTGQQLKNLSTGIGHNNNNYSSGVMTLTNSVTGSTGDLMQFTKNAVLTAKIDHNGEFTIPKLIATGVVRLKNYTVATLPTGTQGDTAYCTDLLAPTYMATAVGGGAVVWKVFFDGTTWKVD
jgi:lysophospholipase L1-like esterase